MSKLSGGSSRPFFAPHIHVIAQRCGVSKRGLILSFVVARKRDGLSADAWADPKGNSS